MPHLPTRRSDDKISGLGSRVYLTCHYSPIPPLLLHLQLIPQSLGGLAFQLKRLGEVTDFLCQRLAFGFPGPVIRLNLHLNLGKRLADRCRTREEGPIITKKEAFEELVCEIKILMLDMSSSTSKHFTGEKGVVTYIGARVLSEECLAIFGQGVSDRSASSCLNERVDAVV